MLETSFMPFFKKAFPGNNRTVVKAVAFYKCFVRFYAALFYLFYPL